MAVYGQLELESGLLLLSQNLVVLVIRDVTVVVQSGSIFQHELTAVDHQFKLYLLKASTTLLWDAVFH